MFFTVFKASNTTCILNNLSNAVWVLFEKQQNSFIRMTVWKKIMTNNSPTQIFWNTVFWWVRLSVLDAGHFLLRGTVSTLESFCLNKGFVLVLKDTLYLDLTSDLTSLHYAFSLLFCTMFLVLVFLIFWKYKQCCLFFFIFNYPNKITAY